MTVSRKLIDIHRHRLELIDNTTMSDAVKQKSKKQLRLIFARVNNNNGCWIPTNILPVKRGYFIVRTAGKNNLLHRLSLLCYCGLPPSGKQNAIHSCDNPSCVNPSHLRWGSHQDNMDDKMKRGRHITKRGEQHHNSKLSKEQVVSIRKEYKNDGVSQDKLAVKYNVGQPQIGRIIRGERWGHITTKD